MGEKNKGSNGGRAPKGPHPAQVYASVRCGFTLTNENRHLMTDEQIDEWEAAIDTWFAAHPDAPPI